MIILENIKNLGKMKMEWYPSAKLDTVQHWPSIGKNVAEDRLPILRRCWNDNSDLHLVANSGPKSGRQHLFSAQQRADSVPNSTRKKI